MQQVAMSINERILDQQSATDESVSDLDKQFGNFVVEVDASLGRMEDRLNEHDGLLSLISDDLDSLNNDVSRLANAVDQLGDNQEIIADFMFSRLSPGEKARALKSGLMDSRIQCPDYSSDCDFYSIRKALQDRYEKESRLIESIKKVRDVSQGMQELSTITNNLGIDFGPELSGAVTGAESAMGAYLGIMSGNYLGALASLSGMFGRRVDPDAERFRIMMNEFERVNSRLNKISQNQQTIFEAVVAVSDQLGEVYRKLDWRLDSIQQETHVMSRDLLRLIWQEWESCYSVYYFALNPDPSVSLRPLINPSTLRIKSFGDASEILRHRGQHVGKCLLTVQTSLDQLSAPSRFGSFLDSRWVLDADGQFGDGFDRQLELEYEYEYWRTNERRYVEEIVEPTTEILFEWARQRGLSFSNLLNLQMQGLHQVSGVGEAIQRLRAVEFDCDGRDASERATRELVCVRQELPNRIAGELMRLAVNVDMLFELSDWMMVVSEVSSLYSTDQSAGAVGGAWAETLSELATFDGASPGKEIVRRMVAVIGLAKAYYGRVYGGLTALIFAEHILAGTAGEEHFGVLIRNKYLAENVALVLLHRIRDTWDIESQFSTPPFEAVYNQALLYARSPNPDRFVPLYALFGEEHDFVAHEKNGIGIGVEIIDKILVLPLPLPMRTAEGRFVFPPRYYELHALQQSLVDRYLDFELGLDEVIARIVLQR